jgi:hypothetical protein
MKKFKIKNSEIRREEYATSRWAINVPAGVTLKDLVNPDFYSNVANQLRKNDYVRAIFEDGSYIVDLLVLDVDKKNLTPVWAKLIIIHVVDIAKARTFSEGISKAADHPAEDEKKEKEEEFSNERFEIKFRGAKKWSVLRKPDNAVLQENLNSKEEAIKAAQELLATLS